MPTLAEIFNAIAARGGFRGTPISDLDVSEIDPEDLKAAFGNPNIQAQGARARALASQRDVNTLKDPQTYAFIAGMLGERPDQMGFSVLHPDYEKIIGRGEQGLVTGGVSMIGPTAQAIKGLVGAGGRGAMALGQAGARYADRVVPEILDRGGLPAEILQGMGQNTRSYMQTGENPISGAVTQITREDLAAKMQDLIKQKQGLTGAELASVNQQIGGLQAQFKQMPSVQRVAKEVVAPEITAPVSDIGFYSATEQAGQGLARQSGTGESFLNDLMKAPDVKKDELSWMGLDDYLKGKPNVTKQEVQDFIAANKVDVKEVKLGGNEAPSQDLLNWMSARSIMPPRNPEGWQELSQKLESYAQQHQKAQGAPEASQRYFTLSEEAGRIAEGLDAGGSSAGATKYQKYQLPGGENYREILLTLPEKTPKTLPEGYSLQPMANGNFTLVSPDNIGTIIYASSKDDAMAEAIRRFTRKEEPYRSSHFNEPNILAHMRVNDRIDAEGKKMLLIEEVQSDWHQAGREKGYKTGNERAPAQVERELTATTQKRSRLLEEAAALPDSEMTKFKAMNEEIKKLSDQATKLNEEWTNLLNKPEGVPDAPFKDTWHQLALKRALKYAADNGYERVGLTTGSQQAERYNLAKQVDEVIAKRNPDGSFNLDATLVNGGQQQSIGKNIPLDKLPDYVGKDLAKSMQAQEFGTDVYSGDALKVGGEGMKKYYDEIYPAFLDKQAKKWNSKTGETKIKRSSGQGMLGGSTVRYIDITPEMKGGLAKGQPLHGLIAAPAVGLSEENRNKLKDMIK